MSMSSRQSQHTRAQHLSRLWRTPGSHVRWFWCCVSALLYIGSLVWYLYAARTQANFGSLADPLRSFGIVTFALVLVTAAYSLRKRFMRDLPGKVQSWLWLHTWFGIITILIALLHDNFARVTHDYCQNLSCLTQSYGATSALFALFFLVISGIIGRLLDVWQTRIIAHEASSNGVGIASSVSARLDEVKYTIERYTAGKSDMFKHACAAMLAGQKSGELKLQDLVADEQSDWQKVQQPLLLYMQLSASLRRLLRAQRILHYWRTMHIIVASLALLIIVYHSVMELLTNIWHISV